MHSFLNRLRDLPIAKKLTLCCVIISTVSLLIAMMAIMIYDRHSFKEILEDELKVLASVISNRSSAAVVFDDRELARSNLKPLQFQDSILGACIYKASNSEKANNGTIRVASYPNSTIVCSTMMPDETVLTETPNNSIELVQPILLDETIIGYLYIHSSTLTLQERQRNHITVLVLVSIAAALVAIWLANMFTQWISAPLKALGKTAQVIAKYDDYSIRAEKYYNDEIGQVVDSFNRMLTVIEREDAKLRESEGKFRLISASSKVGIFQLDSNGHCIYTNEELSQITGISHQEILMNNWLSAIHPDDALALKSKWETMLKDQQPINISCRLINGNGQTKWVNGHIGLLKKSDNSYAGFLGTLNDITEVKNAQVQLEQMAFYDTLTGLANRRLFRNRLEQMINNISRDGSHLGLILLDVDHFKNINDSLGHDSGDLLLTTVADRLQRCVRATDTVARLGGDEFAIILHAINDSISVSQIAKKILDSIKEPIAIAEIEIRITASAGVALAPDDGNNAEVLIKNADLALYRAKDQGRDNYQFFTNEMNTQLIEHLKLREDLRLAVDAEEFSLAYQPQVDIHTGYLVGIEALIRWDSKQRGFVSPLDFIPAAEDTGLILPIGRWVIDAACKELRNLKNKQLVDSKTLMTVNLSVKQFQDEGLVSYIQEKLEYYELNPSQFEIELTETLLMENLDSVVAKLEEIRRLGIIISIDDFGTGYSSLSYLKRLPINIVKVDRSFVMDIPDDQDDMKLTAAVIAMAHNLNYEVVAEGIETIEQLDFLRECGCDYGQGYLFSKPVSSEELAVFCTSNKLGRPDQLQSEQV